MKLRNLALSLTVCTLALPLSAAHLAKAGKWQGTMHIEMPGMPTTMPAQTFVHCVTKEEAENAENLIPKSGDKRGGCVYTDVKVEGSTMTWKMTCEKSGMTGTGTVTYQGDSYTGSMQMKMRDRDMSATYEGKYLGDCDGSEK